MEIEKINDYLQTRLHRDGLDDVPAVQAALWLDAAGLLRDNESRPGLSLRRLLRKGMIVGGDQRPARQNGRWFIVRVGPPARAGAQTQRAESPARGNRGGRLAKAAAQTGRQRMQQPAPYQPGRGADLDARSVAQALQQDLRTVPEATRSANDAGLPTRPGMYAWWSLPGAIPGINGPRHPAAAFELLYVGIAPKDGFSKATLRSRVVRQHIGGNIGSSTFRQSLAALLFQTEGWTTLWSGSRNQLSPEHNRALTQWQTHHLRLTWIEHLRPWVIENEVIRLMQPPLNLAGNASHPMHWQLTVLRAKLRAGS